MKKFLSFIATSAILLNSFYAPLTAIAQEITPSPEPTPEATSTPEPTQTPEETIVPSEEPTVTPEATPTEITSPTPEVIIPPTDTGSPEPTEEAGQETQPQAPESNPTTTSPPEDSPTIEPTFTPAVTDENAVVSTQVVITEMIPETLLENNVIKLITDKLDYSPTEMAIISGSGFIPEKIYSLTVSSTDDPATSTTVDVTINGNGEFTYGYQLDGNYRPNYLVEVKDGEELIASTTFTDSRSITAATVNSGSSTTVSPSGSVTVSLTVYGSGSGTDSWNSTRYTIEGQSAVCVDTADHASGTNTEAFSISAPAAVGIYDLTLVAFENSGCSGNSGSMPLTNAIEVTTPATLPFSETFGGSDSTTVTNWFENDPAEIISGSGNDAPTDGKFARIGNDGWICKTFDATSVSNLVLSYYWKGNGSNSNDTGIVEYKVGGNCSDSSGWTNLYSNQLTDTSWDQQTNALSGNGLVNLRFRAYNAESGEYFRVDSVSLTAFVNTPPTITEGDSTNVTMSKNSSPTAFALTLHAIDADVGQTITWSVSSAASHGTATATGTGASKSISYSPTSNYVGTDSFVIQVSDGNGGTDTITVNVTVQDSNVANPTLSVACGLDIALVLDNSTSIDAGELASMKTAMIAFTTALAGTPTQFSVTKFATTATVVQTFTADITAVNAAINAIPVGGGSTNWEDGLVKAQSTLHNRTNPDLVIFASDGNPNRVDNGTSVDEAQAVSEAVLIANSIKGAEPKTRIIALGIGNDLNVNNLKAISGPTVGTNLSADVITTDFTSLASALATFASSTCGGTITINKYIDTVSANTRGGANWPFTVSDTASVNLNLTTDSNGQINTGTIPAGSGYSVTESSVLPGYSYGSAICRNQTGAIEGIAVSNGVDIIDVSDSDIITCDFINNTATGSISGHKIWDKNQSRVYDTGDEYLPGWTIYVDTNFDSQLNPGETSTTTDVNGGYQFNNLALGQEHRICEVVQSNWNYSWKGCINVTIDSATPNKTNIDFFNYQIGQLRIIKDLVPDGSGWYTLKQDGEAFATLNYDYDSGFSQIAAGNHVISEEGANGTNLSDFSVVYSGDCDSQGNVTVGQGESKTCTITNYLSPKITVTKNVIGGTFSPSDFTMQVGNVWQTGSNTQTFPGSSSGTTVNLKPGDYSVGEADQNTHQMTLSGDCSGSVTWGDVKTCTVTNTKFGSISGTKFEDLNGSGERDYHWENDTPIYDEPGIPGWEIYIDSNKDGDWDADEPKTTTDADGNYSFNGLTGDDKRVREIGKPGWIQTSTDPQDQPVSNGNDWANINFGNFELASISGIKYNDLNGNGSKDPGENGLSGWTIVIDKNNNQVFDAGDLSTTTDSNGNYSFTNLTRGTYHGYTYIVMEIPQAGWTPVNPADGIQYVQILSGTNATNINFGNKRDTGTITIIKDAVNNSSKDFSFDTNMPGLGGDFDLEDDGNNSDGHKNYITRTVPVGSYWIREDGENGWKMTDISCSGDGSSSINESEQKVDISLKANENVTCTFTNTELAKVFGYKFKDENTNGNWDWHHPYYERALGNWRIFIDDGNGIYDGTEPSRITNNWLWYIPFWTGYYEFDNLLPGTYSICEEPQSGWTNVTPVCRTVELTPGSNHITNFGNIDNGTVTVTKFNDENQNGIFDNDESTLNGWTINLDQDSLTTGENGQNEGQVLFTNVTQGDHGLNENLQEGWRQTNIYCDRVSDGLFSVNAQSISILPIASYIVHVVAGQNVNCYVGNFEENPGISITKTNDKSGGTFAGDTITYTLSVKNTGNINLDLLKVTDYLPGGFSYVPGSTSGAITSDPSLEASSLTWILDSIAVNETKTISYKVLVSSDVSSGTHTNYATCKAIKSGPTDLKFTRLVADISTDQIDDVVYCNTSSSSVSVGNGLSYGGSLGGQVLGASTMLPATGNPTWMLFAALGLTGTGIYLNIRSKKENKHAKN